MLLALWLPVGFSQWKAPEGDYSVDRETGQEIYNPFIGLQFASGSEVISSLEVLFYSHSSLSSRATIFFILLFLQT